MFYYEILVDLHAVLRTNTEKNLCTFYPVSPNGNILQNYILSAGGVTHGVECLPSKCKALSSVPSTTHTNIYLKKSLSKLNSNKDNDVCIAEIQQISITTSILHVTHV
jgi:hypothetical protein